MTVPAEQVVGLPWAESDVYTAHSPDLWASAVRKIMEHEDNAVTELQSFIFVQK